MIFIKNQHKTKKAFTLIELLVSAAIFLIILASIYGVLSIGVKTWWLAYTKIDIIQNLRNAEFVIAKELHQARRASIITTPDNSGITFQMPVAVSGEGNITLKQINYYLGGENQNQLMRNAENEALKVLANDINSISFEQDLSSPHIVMVNITASKADKTNRVLTYSISFTIKTRN